MNLVVYPWCVGSHNSPSLPLHNSAAINRLNPPPPAKRPSGLQLGLGVDPWLSKQPPNGGVVGGSQIYATAPAPLCDIPSGCCFFTGPWTFTHSSLRMLRWVTAFCRPLQPVLLLVSFPRSQSPVVGVLGLCWMWWHVPFVRQQRPVAGVLGLCWFLRGSLTLFAVDTPSSSSRPQPASLCFRVREAQVPCSSTLCPGRPPYTLPHSVPPPHFQPWVMHHHPHDPLPPSDLHPS